MYPVCKATFLSLLLIAAIAAPTRGENAPATPPNPVPRDAGDDLQQLEALAAAEWGPLLTTLFGNADLGVFNLDHDVELADFKVVIPEPDTTPGAGDDVEIVTLPHLPQTIGGVFAVSETEHRPFTLDVYGYWDITEYDEIAAIAPEILADNPHTGLLWADIHGTHGSETWMFLVSSQDVAENRIIMMLPFQAGNPDDFRDWSDAQSLLRGDRLVVNCPNLLATVCKKIASINLLSALETASQQLKFMLALAFATFKTGLSLCQIAGYYPVPPFSWSAFTLCMAGVALVLVAELAAAYAQYTIAVSSAWSTYRQMTRLCCEIEGYDGTGPVPFP